jgi:hypothetical protein
LGKGDHEPTGPILGTAIGPDEELVIGVGKDRKSPKVLACDRRERSR